MRPTIYFLSKTAGHLVGGALIRQAQVDYFRNRGHRVRLVVPEPAARTLRDPDVISIPLRVPFRVGNILQHAGLVQDYLFEWVHRAVSILRKEVREGDVIFASAGGELGCLQVASTLRRFTSCRYVANLHDPTTYATIDGVHVGRSMHVSRDKWEHRFLENADLIIVSTKSYGAALARKYPLAAPRIRQMYFGYVNKSPLLPRSRTSDSLRIVYGGTFRKTQRPERIAEIAADMPGIEVVYVGDHDRYAPLDRYRNRVTCLPAMPRDDFNSFLMRDADVGFVGLAEEQWWHCVPSKIFEYIHTGLPMLGALPAGEACDLINNGGYGIAKHFTDRAGLREAITQLKNADRWAAFRQKIEHDRAAWELNARMDEILDFVLGLDADRAAASALDKHVS